ncbi:Dynein regulatory complex protein 12 [Plasmodiophora brassicae]|uniref:Dynein regulatory complex protein 12 n=1 Tax=Plasmodiophora brassicae TaxID=37360 RepID=A0A0G4ILD4_PLABS|nr:hypothetical protein PBRA_004678 [Plasmodiophora brassicae]SPQ93467.1 unnamed protein product [Plasmodiophora brassicae]
MHFPSSRQMRGKLLGYGLTWAYLRSGRSRAPRACRSVPPMPPKKKGKKAAAKKAADPSDAPEEPLSVEMQNLFLKRQVESLKHRLIMAANLASQSETEARELRRRLNVLNEDFVQERKNSFEITADMTRQYKSMKQELLQTINTLNAQIMQEKDRYAQKETAMQVMEAKKDDLVATKNAEIAEWKKKVDEMAMEFSQMLKQTLDKMSERIIISNDEWDAEGGEAPPIQKRLEGFTLGSSA